MPKLPVVLMNRILSSLLVLVAIFLSGCNNETQSNNSNKNESKSTMNSEDSTAKNDSSSEPDCYVIDVRSKKEWDGGHLESAVHIPHTEIVEGIAKVTQDKNAKIYLY